MIATTFLALLACAPLQDGLAPEKVKAVDQLFTRWNRITSPGCVIAVYQNGALAYGKGFGSANLEHQVPIETDTVFRIASTSKQFTAACVVLLELDGALSFKDDVRKWIPELPEYSAPILIEDLVHHTSGLRDYLQLLEWAGHSDESEVNNEALLSLITRQQGLNHPPGEEHSYTNTGYFLLSIIVERVSGESLRKFAKRRLFDPLGMEHTFFNDDADEVIPKRATGYELGWRGKAFRISETRLEVVGDGAVFTSAEDLFLWDQNFYEPKLGGQSFLKRMLEPGVLRNGEVLDYASGLTVDEYRGLRLIAHGGAFVGFRAQMMRFPDQQTSILCLSNRADFDPSARCLDVAELLLGELMGEKEAERSKPTARRRSSDQDPLPAPQPEECEGRYQSEELGVTWSFRAAGEFLYIERWGKPRRLSANEEGLWVGIGAEFRFKVDSNGRISGFTLSSGRANGIEFERAQD
jgi:CubicO group peptidase (beta-lactamase class C family)